MRPSLIGLYHDCTIRRMTFLSSLSDRVYSDDGSLTTSNGVEWWLYLVSQAHEAVVWAGPSRRHLKWDWYSHRLTPRCCQDEMKSPSWYESKTKKDSDNSLRLERQFDRMHSKNSHGDTQSWCRESLLVVEPESYLVKSTSCYNPHLVSNRSYLYHQDIAKPFAKMANRSNAPPKWQKLTYLTQLQC